MNGATVTVKLFNGNAEVAGMAKASITNVVNTNDLKITMGALGNTRDVTYTLLLTFTTAAGTYTVLTPITIKGSAQ